MLSGDSDDDLPGISFGSFSADRQDGTRQVSGGSSQSVSRSPERNRVNVADPRLARRQSSGQSSVNAGPVRSNYGTSGSAAGRQRRQPGPSRVVVVLAVDPCVHVVERLVLALCRQCTMW